MVFCPPQSWVWDFWIADDGATYHLYFLNAPRSLGHPDARHRNARIGHAVSTDLRHWTDRGPVLERGEEEAFDATAVWTGCVVRDDTGLWRMFYTGARFLSEKGPANVETVGLAVSTDLNVWKKRPGSLLSADRRWYETLGSSPWPEEAWRDPWVFRGTDGNWHMLLTARSRDGDPLDRGIVGHATSRDLDHWLAAPPLSLPGSGYAHIEVMQIVDVGGCAHMVFSCDSSKLAGDRAGGIGGIWTMPLASLDHVCPSEARLLLPESHYSGRVVCDRQKKPMLLACLFEGGDVVGLSDPMALTVDADGYLALEDR
ncbi:glycosyl hydrolase family 32 [Pleomorphomonas diazotrophica]|uniref:Glycosyl hydrolase family 32 n=1 Tax=Pleomorphomonas diazotrophica TaxID=1166257 RepID=A0A1I4WH90_9HYPH|nr:glycosyl hydrolase family 32 [Pleomorphomonas diazotrophica]PKR89101.1 glycosyl hydrolase family 32 [Pleomorphomonas diazotrophica]SFN13181.1 beta-fructofuranosidase [Pleomorphomonas diazotrophica]